MTTCANIEIELESLQFQINDTRSAINKWISQTNSSENPGALRSYADFLVKEQLNASDHYNKSKFYQQEAQKLGCAAEVSKAAQLSNQAAGLEQQSIQGVQAAKNKAQRLQLETSQATTSTDNSGTGKPNTAGTGKSATPDADELNEVAVTTKKKPVPVTNDPAYKEAPRGADDFGDVAPGLEATKPKIVAEEPNLIGAGTVDVAAPNFDVETGADTNTGLQEATDDAQAQATVQDAQNWALQGDWRVRLALAPQSPSILYRADDAGVLAPLKDTDGVIFPYTPAINVTYSANYEPLTLTHTNYKTFQYQSSSIDQITISCDFTAQDTDEANYMLAVIHFFRAATKMFYGQNQSPKTGTPPPLCYLYGFGQLQFNAHPLVIASFNYNLPTDVDYIRATTSPSSPPGVNRSPSNTRDNSPDISNSRLNSGGQSIAPGGQVPPAQLPQTAAGGTVEPTYVPTRVSLQITAYPVVTRYDQSRVFNNKQYNNGQLLLGSQRGLGGGFW